MKKHLILLTSCLVLWFSSLSHAQLQSQSADPTKSLTCLITTDFYIVHLTSYSVPEGKEKKRSAFTPYCQELHEHGPSYLAIDFIDRDLRQMPVGLRVISEKENPEGEGMIEGEIIAESPVQTYKNGVAQIRAVFPEPGKYALIATVGDDMFADKIRIPLRVGIGSEFKWSSLLPYFLAILAIVLGYLIYKFFIWLHNKKNQADA